MLVCLFTFVPITAVFVSAADQVSYLDKDGKTQSVSNYHVLTGYEIELKTGWYVLSSDIDWDDRVIVSGEVFLILCDDCTLEAGGGIDVSKDNSLTIYAQSAGDRKGVLNADATNSDPYAAGIGSIEEIAGTITINGVEITAIGGVYGAGIGSGEAGSCSSITISGGKVTASGGKYAAGIGSGGEGSVGASCGDITITKNVIQVTAKKGLNAQSIGCGDGGSCGTVTIETGANVIQY